jgi:hypothetical protein
MQKDHRPSNEIFSVKKLYAKYRVWREKGFIETDGVIVGCDQTQEWLLPWWWDHYRKHNAYPVAFVDLGMSFSAKEWCKKQGEYIHLPVADIFVAERSEIDPSLVQQWEKVFVNFWEPRNAWFKKPLACLQSPFRRTIWIDLDCEVRGSIEGLFPLCDSSGLAIGRGEESYNTGVIAFIRNLKLIKAWAELAFSRNHEAVSDEDLLNDLLRSSDFTVFPPIYNWSRCWNNNPDAILLHWHGNYGKIAIAHQIRIKNI